jgi:hypothetical protein
VEGINTETHGTARRGAMARHGTARHGTARHGTAWRAVEARGGGARRSGWRSVRGLLHMHAAQRSARASHLGLWPQGLGRSTWTLCRRKERLN